MFVSLFSDLFSICTSQSFVTLWILFFFLIPLSFFILPSEINIVMPLFKASITKLWILLFPSPSHSLFLCLFILFLSSKLQPPNLAPFVDFCFSFFLFYLCVHLFFSSLQSSSTKPESHCRFFSSLQSSNHQTLHPLWIFFFSFSICVHLFFSSLQPSSTKPEAIIDSFLLSLPLFICYFPLFEASSTKTCTHYGFFYPLSSPLYIYFFRLFKASSIKQRTLVQCSRSLDCLNKGNK